MYRKKDFVTGKSIYLAVNFPNHRKKLSSFIILKIVAILLFRFFNLDFQLCE